MSNAEPLITLGQYLSKRLRQWNVDHLFGVPGDFNLALLDGLLSEPGEHWINSANELNAAYAADGYARTRGFAAVVTTYGVGELSAVNGTAGSYAESVPLLHVVGIPSNDARDAGLLLHHTFLDGDYAHFLRAYKEVTASAEIVAEDTAAEQIDRALETAQRESRPVYLGVPVDVAAHARLPAGRLSRPLARPASNARSLAAFGAALEAHLADEDVTVVVGHLARRRHLQSSVARIADTGRATVASLMNAKGMLDEEHPAYAGTYLGALTLSEDTQTAVEKAEGPLVLAGAALSDFASGMFSAQLDTAGAVLLGLREARIAGQTFDQVDLVDTLAALAELLEKDGRRPATAERSRGTSASRAAFTPPSRPLSQSGLWRQVQDFLDPGSVILADAGTALFGAVDLRLPRASELVTQSIWASIGYTLPALLGTCLGDRGSRPLLLIGDGAAQFTMQELGVILQQELTPVIVLLNNAGYTIERAIRSPDAVYQDIPTWDWSRMVTAMGKLGRVVTLSAGSEAELAAALDEARRRTNQAVFIEAFLDRGDVPRFLAGFVERLAAMNNGR